MKTQEGEEFLIDLTFVNSCSASRLNVAASVSIARAENQKREKYAEFLNEAEMESFVPFALDGAGNLGEAAVRFLSYIGDKYVKAGSGLAGNVRAGLWEVWWNWSYHYSRKFNAGVDSPDHYQKRNKLTTNHLGFAYISSE